MCELGFLGFILALCYIPKYHELRGIKVFHGLVKTLAFLRKSSITLRSEGVFVGSCGINLVCA